LTGTTTGERGGADTMNDAGSPGTGAAGGMSPPRAFRARKAPPITESADEEGLRAAFVAHSGELYGYARRSLSDAGAAEEVVQETFIRAWRARERFDPELGSLRTWLFAIERRPEGTVRSRLFYALQSLRLTLDEMGWDE
jgi:DNA-directed RNA polymerase specialized sigma24 family protein